MMKQSRVCSLNLLIVLLVIACISCAVAFLFTPISISYAENLINNSESFEAALSTKQKVINVDDIIFDENTQIRLNYSVKIVGKNNKSQLKNIHFVIDAPNTDDNMITIEFSNIEFNGAFDLTKYSLEEGKDFEEIFGSELEDNVCITGDIGYYKLYIDNCDFNSYCSYTGACIEISNAFRSGHKYLYVSNSKFHNNFTRSGTVSVGNDLLYAEFDSCEFYSNTAGFAAGIQLANGSGVINNCKVHDNIFFNYSDLNPQNIGGGMFIGGCNAVVKNTSIYNNEAKYGGGIGLASAQNGDGEVLLKDCKIYSNKARVKGGGIAIFSLVGQPINILNTTISSNEAPSCGSLYIETYAGWIKANKGGIVNLIFDTIALNKADDSESFIFHSDRDDNLGKIYLKGCIVLDKDTYESNADEYNTILTKEKALEENKVTEEDLQKFASEFYLPSSLKMNIPASIYSTWHSEYENATETVLSGEGDKVIVIVPEYKEPIDVKKIVLATIIPVFAVVSLVMVLVFVKNKKKQNVVKDQKEETKKETKVEENVKSPQVVTKPLEEISDDEIKEKLSSLSERELQVVKLTIELKKRKEIADILMFSENTIKKDITNIYLKLDVKDKMELISRYKDFI